MACVVILMEYHVSEPGQHHNTLKANFKISLFVKDQVESFAFTGLIICRYYKTKRKNSPTQCQRGVREKPGLDHATNANISQHLV